MGKQEYFKSPKFENEICMRCIKKIVFLMILFISAQGEIVCSQDAPDIFMQELVRGIGDPEYIFSSSDLANTLQIYFEASLEWQNAIRDSLLTYRYENGDTLLTRAAKDNKSNAIKFVVTIGIDSNGINSKGRSALSTALIWDNYEAAAILIENNAVIQPSDRPIICGPFLSWLIEHDKLCCIKKLEYAGIINLNKQRSDGSTVLHCAVKHEAKTILKYLIEKKEVDLNQQILISTGEASKKGFTALHCAAVQGLFDMIKLLVDAGADQAIKDETGKVAYDYAQGSRLKILLTPILNNDLLLRKKIEDCLKKRINFRSSLEYRDHQEFIKLNPELVKLCKRFNLDIRSLLMPMVVGLKKNIANSSFDIVWTMILMCTKSELMQKCLAQKHEINGFGHDMVNKNGDVVTKSFDEHVITEQDIPKIIELYPMLAEGFDLFSLDFKDFLQKKLLDRDLHDPVFDWQRIKISTVLHSAIIEAEEKINHQLWKKETRHHLAEVVKRDLWNSHSDTTDDAIFNYVLKYEHTEMMQWLAEKIENCRNIREAFESNSARQLREGCEVLGIDGLQLLDPLPLFNNQKSYYHRHDALALINNKIKSELVKPAIKLRITQHFRGFMGLYANIDMIQGPIINYVKKYRHDDAMKEVLREYIHYSSTSIGCKKSILEKVLAMPNKPKKFDFIASLLIDTDLIKTEPVLRIAEDLETLRFLIDHGATDTAGSCPSQNRNLYCHVTSQKNILQHSAVRTMKYQSNSGLGLPYLFLQMNKKVVQDEMIFNAKKYDAAKVVSYYDLRLQEARNAEIEAKNARQARLTIGTDLK